LLRVKSGGRRAVRLRNCAPLAILLLLSSNAFADPIPEHSAERKSTGVEVAKIETVVVTGRARSLTGIAQSANQGTVGAADIALRPILRPGEIVENVPGVIITQHSGSGKANQYFLRGFNLDHGTDLAVSVDDVPVNMPSHAHGQGYADLNFAIPELVEAVDFKRGPYYADVGDFGSAGAFNIRYYDVLPSGFAEAQGGSFGYGKALAADNAALANGNLIYAAQFEHNDGPWDIPDDARKLDGLLRYSQGSEAQGFSLTAIAYHNIWHSTDQVPDRAITEGLIDRLGAIDPSDGGKSGRYALSAEWHSRDADSATQMTVYGLHYDLDLFSDFTYFLDDPIHGDQIEQQDNRFVFGGRPITSGLARSSAVQSRRPSAWMSVTTTSATACFIRKIASALTPSTSTTSRRPALHRIWKTKHTGRTGFAPWPACAVISSGSTSATSPAAIRGTGRVVS